MLPQGSAQCVMSSTFVQPPGSPHTCPCLPVVFQRAFPGGGGASCCASTPRVGPGLPSPALR